MGKFAVILIAAMLIAGCKVGGGSGSGSHFVHNPEPSSLALFGVGLFGLAMAKLKKKKKSSDTLHLQPLIVLRSRLEMKLH